MKPQNNNSAKSLFQSMDRPADIWAEENNLFLEGYKYVAGIDEAGRGPLAGPVVAACVCSKEQITDIPGVTDSKKLSHKKRILLKEKIISHNQLFYGIGIVSPEDIDRLNILQASLFAFKKAIDNLKVKPDYCLVDGNHKSKYIDIPQKPMIKGDSRSFLIAAASIIAKETRDDILNQYDKKWPEYEFSSHKGYPTKKHLEKISKYGVLPIHRRSFAPVRKVINSNKNIADNSQAELF